MSPASELYARIRRALKNNTGLHLSLAELRLLAELGLLRILMEKEIEEITAEWQKPEGGDQPDTTPAAKTPRAYSVATLAAHWRCSDGTVRNLIKSGQLECFRYGNLIRITPQAVAAYEAKSMAAEQARLSTRSRERGPLSIAELSEGL